MMRVARTAYAGFMKIRPMGPELLHPDRQVDSHDEANCLFSQFANAPKNGSCQGHQLVLFSKLYRTALGPTHPSIQWVSGAV